MKQLITIILIAFYSIPTMAGGLESLENFIKTVRSGRADFTQVVTVPARQGQAARMKTSSGTFEFIRPKQFKFVYQKPFEQTIVADGRTLWLYDVDLNQVTARKQAQTLAATPAALVAAAPTLQALQADFVLADAPDLDGLHWVSATAKAKDSMLQSVRLGFLGTPGGSAQLAVLEIYDSFGQRSVLRFSRFEVNVELPRSHFQFIAPAGVDVIQQ